MKHLYCIILSIICTIKFCRISIALSLGGSLLVANLFFFVLELKAGSAWPRANGCKEWETVNRDLLVILNRLRGNAKDRLFFRVVQRFGVHDRGVRLGYS